MTTSRWRVAAGAWLLATGMVLGAGAVALADPGTDATKDPDGSSAAGNPTAGANEPTAVGAEQQRHAEVSEPSAIPDTRDTIPDVPAHTTATEQSRAETVTPDEAPPSSHPAPTTDSPVAEPATVDTSSPATSSHDVESQAATASGEPSTTTVPSEPTADPAPAASIAAPTADPVTSTTIDVDAEVSPTVETIPSLGNAAAVHAGRRSAGVRTSASSPPQLPRFAAGASDRGWAGNVTADRSLAHSSGTAASAASSASAAMVRAASTSMAARVTPNADLPEGLRLFLRSYGQIIVAASLSAMAAAALPGIAGMLIPTLAAIRVGYRQAKAGRSLRASGIARFAASGPIGVVRSGSMVTVRPRASRAVRLRPRHGEQVPLPRPEFDVETVAQVTA